MINLGIVGCGDVAFRNYLPGIKAIAEKACVAACFDTRRDRAERAASLFPGALVYDAYAELLRHPGLDAIVNLTPAPFHRQTTTAALDAGLHVYSEKPLAATVEEARSLIDRARSQDLMLLCAPAAMATSRFKWMGEILRSGRIGRPTLAVCQYANMGPARWRGYTGDPAVFYGPDVGPLLDTGVYLLHAITGLLGPVRRLQAFGGVAIPQRNVLVSHQAGGTVEVSANDHMLLHLDLGDGAFAQLLSSFAVPASKAPALEIHCTEGSMSVKMDGLLNANGPIDMFFLDDSPTALEGWMDNLSPPNPGPVRGLIESGVPHFVACLRGEERAVLTAEHACHVLEVIVKSAQSVCEGRALDLETRF